MKKDKLQDLFSSFEGSQLNTTETKKIFGGYATSCSEENTQSSGKSDDCDIEE